MELRITGPHRWWMITVESQQSDHPVHVFLAPAAPKLLAKRNVLKVESEVLSVVPDLLKGSHFTGTYHLVLIEQKDRNPGSGNEFVDLQAIGS
jgi:hypothetical protein